MHFVYGRRKTFNIDSVSNPSGPVVQSGMNDDRVVASAYAAFACPAGRGGGRGFKSRPVHQFLGAEPLAPTRRPSLKMTPPFIFPHYLNGRRQDRNHDDQHDQNGENSLYQHDHQDNVALLNINIYN